eukprot:823084-Amorphochlora_amoeboformis.AAC.1
MAHTRLPEPNKALRSICHRPPPSSFTGSTQLIAVKGNRKRSRPISALENLPIPPAIAFNKKLNLKPSHVSQMESFNITIEERKEMEHEPEIVLKSTIRRKRRKPSDGVPSHLRESIRQREEMFNFLVKGIKLRHAKLAIHL